MIGDYGTLRDKINSAEKGDWLRIGRLLGFYCTLSELHPQQWCVVRTEYNRCELFETCGPSLELPETTYESVEGCKCVRRNDIYACPLFLRMSQIYFDVMEDVDDKGKEEGETAGRANSKDTG